MDAQIHAAIVGGVIGGGTLGAGVVASEWLQRSRTRRATFEASVLHLARLLPFVSLPASELWAGPRPDARDPSWLGPFNEANDLLLVMTQQCQGFRNARAAGVELRLLLAHFDALFDEFITTGRPLKAEELADVRADRLLRVAIPQPPGGYIDDIKAQYREERGLSPPP